MNPRSHCGQCQKLLGPLELVPVVSYLALRGRCLACRALISPRILAVEVFLGAGFALLWWWFGPGPKLAVMSLYLAFFTLIVIVDLEHRLVLNKVVYPAIVAAPVTALLWGHSPEALLAGGAVGFLSLLLPGLLVAGGMGGGDIKLGAFIGMMSGFPGVIVALAAAVLAGALVSCVLLAFGGFGRRDPVPFAPFLALGAMTSLWWGDGIVEWYLGFLR